MATFSTLTFSCLTAATTLALTLAFTPHVRAQGYKGLIPDDTPQGAQTQKSGNGDGYSGLIPPSPQTPADNAPQPRGYAGVIPGETVTQSGGEGDVTGSGKTAKRTAPTSYSPAQDRSIEQGTDSGSGFTPIRRTPEMTYRPGFKPRPPVLTAEQLKTLSTLAAHGIDFSKLPASFEKSIHMPPGTFETLSHPQNRIDGMLPTEFAIKRMIDTTMSIVNNPQLTADQRHAQAQAAIDRLSRMADGMRITKNIPMSIYEKMGAPEVYVQQELEGSTKALDRLNEALNALSQM